MPWLVTPPRGLLHWVPCGAWRAAEFGGLGAVRPLCATPLLQPRRRPAVGAAAAPCSRSRRPRCLTHA
eukprot:7671-Chlamydomonas_euryale.AAC.7